MNSIIYKVTCLTNLHVGNGEMNFDIIDNSVEKDPVTGLPTINSSGVKGSLRQFFKGKADEDTIKSIFGSEQKKSQGESSVPGKVKFYQADLLARPVRASKGPKSNYMCTSSEAIEILNNKISVFGGKTIAVNNAFSKNTIGVEGVSELKVTEELGAYIDNEVVILSDSQLRDIPLPVLARNQLDDGISKNLWYEEVVPHKSIFTFAVSSDYKEVLEKFDNVMGEKTVVQFGGNASIGYGVCRVEKMEAHYEDK